MAICYNKLFKILSEKGMSKTELQKKIGMSSTTVAKLSKNENVSLKIIEDICSTLNCQPGDILEVNNRKKNLLLDLLCIEKDMCSKDGLYGKTQIKFVAAMQDNLCFDTFTEKFTEEQISQMYINKKMSFKEAQNVSIENIICCNNMFHCLDYVLDVAEKSLDEMMLFEMNNILQNGLDNICLKKNSYGLHNYNGNRTFRKKEFEYKIKNEKGYTKVYSTCDPIYVHSELVRVLALYEQKSFPDFNDLLELFSSIMKIRPFDRFTEVLCAMIVYKECLKNKIIPFIIDKEWNNQDVFDEIYIGSLHNFNYICLKKQDEYKKLVDTYADYYQIKYV